MQTSLTPEWLLLTRDCLCVMVIWYSELLCINRYYSNRKEMEYDSTSILNLYLVIIQVSAVSNAVCSLTGMNADHLIFKRKYKTNPTKNSSKWWFVIRSDEALLKNLEEKWHLIALQTNWKIEPVLRFSDDPNATSPNHEDPPTEFAEFKAGTSSDTQPPPISDAFLENK